MRRKREQQKQTAAKAELEKNKGLPGDDKIMNILSSTENQGLINNLLGIGKSLGLTGKQAPPPPPPPATTASAVPSVQTATMTSSPQAIAQSTPQGPVMNMMSSNAMASSAWPSQQWAPQYNAGMNVSSFSTFPSGVPPPTFGAPQTQMPPPNFTQPPPSFSNVPNFSQPPPGFASNDSRGNSNARPAPSNVQGKPPPFGPNSGSSIDGNSQIDRPGQAGPMNSFDPNRQKDGPPTDRFPRDGPGDQQSGQFRPSDTFGQRNESYNKLNDERPLEADQFRREDRGYQEHGNNQFNPQKMSYGNDRFGPGNDRFGPGNNRFAPTNDRFGPGNDRFGPDRSGPGNDRFGPDRSGSGNDRFGPDRSGPGNDRFGPDRLGPGNDRFGPGNNRFGNERFGPGADRMGQANEPLNDRFGPGGDRFGPNNEPFGPGGDRFNLDRFDTKDMGDRRDNFANAPRGFNRNDQFEQSNKLPPELKKLMEKRRAALDVFRPSFLDSDKGSSIGSLSESFKKITGDSPFMKNSSGNNSFGPRGPSNFGPGGPGNYRMPLDFKPPGNAEYGPHCSTGMGRNNSFEPRDRGPVPFRGPNSSPHQVPDFMNTEPRPEMLNLAGDMDMHKENNSMPANTAQQAEAPNEQVDNIQKDGPDNFPVQESTVPLMEKPSNWNDGPFPENKSLQIDASNVQGPENLPGNYISSEQGTQNATNEATEKEQDACNIDSNDINKKTDVLPFMGENDPKPEDLNMEPPPDLPNLGPVSSAVHESNDPLRRTNEPFDAKESSLKPFPDNPECYDRETFDPALGPRGMPFRPSAPFSGPRGPNDRFPVPEPRGPNTFNSANQNQYPLASRDGPFGPRGPNAGQFGPRGPNDGQFGPRGVNDRLFGPRGPNDGLLGPRGSNDGPLGSKGLNDGPMGLRGSVDEPLGSRGPNDGPLGLRGSNDGPRGLRSLLDGPLGSRGPMDGPLGSRGSMDGPHGSRGPMDGPLGPRGASDGPFGSRGPSGGPFGPPKGPSDAPFAPRGSVDGPFTPRGPNNGPFGPRGPNDGPFGPRGPSDGPFGPRGLLDNKFGPRGPNSGQFVPRGPNSGQFGPRYDDQFGPRRLGEGQFGSAGPNDGQFGPQGPNRPFGPGRLGDAPFDNRGSGDSQFAPRGSSEVQIKFPGPVERPFESRPNEGPFQRNLGGMKGSNDGQFPNRFDRPFDAPVDGNFGPQGPRGPRGPVGGPNDGPFPPRVHPDRPFDTRLDEFRPRGSVNENTEAGGPDVRGDGGAFEPNDRTPSDQKVQQRPFDSKEMQDPAWRPPFAKNTFGDVDKRPGDFGYNEKQPLLGQSEAFNPPAPGNVEQRPPLNPVNIPDKRPEKDMPDVAAGYGESSYGGANAYMKRPVENRQSQVRCPPVKEFCIEKQFNYNHGGAVPDKKFVEHIPAKVIDYAHTSRTTVQDHLTPVQCFDYGHGNLKPVVPEHEVHPKKDFRDWEENEQNLKEYTEKLKTYEHYAEVTDFKRSGEYKQRRNSEESIDDKKPERGRREKEDYKGKERDDRKYDVPDKDRDQDNRYDKSSNKGNLFIFGGLFE